MPNDLYDVMRQPVRYGSFDPSQNPYFSFSQTPLGNIGGLVDLGWNAAAERGMVPHLVSQGRGSAASAFSRLQQQQVFQQLTEYQKQLDQQRLTEMLMRQTRMSRANASMAAVGVNAMGLGGSLMLGGQMSAGGLTQLMQAAQSGNGGMADLGGGQGMINAFNSYFGFDSGNSARISRTYGLSRDELAQVTNFALTRAGADARRRLSGKATDAWYDMAAGVGQDIGRQYGAEARKLFESQLLSTRRADKALEVVSDFVVKQKGLKGAAGQGVMRDVSMLLDRQAQQMGLSHGDLQTQETLQNAMQMKGVDVQAYTKVFAELGEQAEEFINVLENSFGRMDPNQVASMAMQMKGLAGALNVSLEQIMSLVDAADRAATAIGGRRLTSGESMAVVRGASAAMYAAQNAGLTGQQAQTFTSMIAAAQAKIKTGPREEQMNFLFSRYGDFAAELSAGLTGSNPEDRAKAEARLAAARNTGVYTVGGKDMVLDENHRRLLQMMESPDGKLRARAQNLLRQESELQQREAMSVESLRKQVADDPQNAELRMKLAQAEKSRAAVNANRKRRENQGFDYSDSLFKGLGGTSQNVWRELDETLLEMLPVLNDDPTGDGRKNKLALAGIIYQTALEGGDVLSAFRAAASGMGIDASSMDERTVLGLAGKVVGLGREAGSTGNVNVTAARLSYGGEKMDQLMRSKMAEKAMHSARASATEIYGRVSMALADPESNGLFKAFMGDDNKLDVAGFLGLAGVDVKDKRVVTANALRDALAKTEGDQHKAVIADLASFSSINAQLSLLGDSDDDRKKRSSLLDERSKLLKGDSALGKALASTGLGDEDLSSSLKLYQDRIYEHERTFRNTTTKIEGTLKIVGDSAKIAADGKTDTPVGTGAGA